MRNKEYGMCNVLGEENLAKAMDDKLDDGYTIHSIVWKGQAQVMPMGIVKPEEQVGIPIDRYLLVVERDFVPLSLEDEEPIEGEFE